MGWALTGGLFAAALGVFLLARHQSNRPIEPGRVRLIPWTTLMILAAVAMLFLVVHLVNLAGVKTGRF